MKKIYIAILLAVLCLPATVMAQKNRPARHAIFAGPALMPALQISGFEDFDISDWQDYGLKSQNPASAEGRVRVPLKNRINPGATIGFGVGYRLRLTDALFATATIPITFSKNVVRMGILPGLTYNVINKKGIIFTDDAFRVGISPAAGLDLISIGFGKIRQVQGYTSPVVIKQGTFADGYTLQVNTLGFAYQLGLSLEYEVSRKISFLVQAGYGGTSFGNLSIQVDDNETSSNGSGSSSDETPSITIKLKDAAIVKTDLSSTQANINPRISSKGLYGLVGIGFKFGK